MISINRAQKRSIVSKLKAKGYTEKQIELFLLAWKRKSYESKIKPGDKVRLDRDAMTKDPNWKRKELKFRVWCMEHFEDTFTAEIYKESRKDLWQFTEDNTSPKWLFHVSDLIVVKENSNLEPGGDF